MEDTLIVETFVQLCYQLPLPIILYRFSKIRDNKVNFFEPNLRGNDGRFLKAMAHNKIVHTLAFIEDSGLS